MHFVAKCNVLQNQCILRQNAIVLQNQCIFEQNAIVVQNQCSNKNEDH